MADPTEPESTNKSGSSDLENQRQDFDNQKAVQNELEQSDVKPKLDEKVTTSSSSNKKKKKKKTSDTVDGQTKEKQAVVAPTMDIRTLQKMIAGSSIRSAEEEANDKTYLFWDTQPVPKLGDSIEEDTNEPVEGDKEDIRQESFSLPGGFVWDTLDLGNEEVLKELYTLLNENYVEDDDNMFRFDYSPEFLTWALRPPGWKMQWHCGVRVVSNNKLVGFISAVPANIKIYEKYVKMVEINFLCVHKKLRSKRVAPVLIREITRRVNMEGIFQAVYTAGIVLPKPVGTCRYWHRSLNPKKLIDVKFSHLKRNMTMQRTIKLYKLPETTKTPGLRPMTQKDVKSGHTLLSKYLSQFQLAPDFTEEEFEHWFLPRDGVVTCHVATDDEGNVTDMVSFYTLPSTVVDHPKHKTLKAAYSFYNVASRAKLSELMNDALVVAKNNDFDVFNALNLMHNDQFLEELKFGIGDGNLNYYLYNWKCPTIGERAIGLVLQ